MTEACSFAETSDCSRKRLLTQESGEHVKLAYTGRNALTCIPCVRLKMAVELHKQLNQPTKY
jgi:hypothetical protein